VTVVTSLRLVAMMGYSWVMIRVMKGVSF